jgi:peptide subunit release factor 1 (eRF1)
MISREELRELAEFECRRPSELAVTFYFQPGAPKDKSHREEAILAKDLVRNTLQELEVSHRSRELSGDVERILRLVESMRGNHARAKAVFACSERNLWREFDLPANSFSNLLFVNRRFHLKPLAPLFSEHPRLWIALVDQQNARFIETHFDQVREQGAITNRMPRHGRSDGYAGYDAGHTQRHAEDEIRRHFRAVAEILRNGAERKQFNALVIGCHDVNWPDLEHQLHPDVSKKIVGRFSGDLGTLSNEKAVGEANGILRRSLAEHQRVLLRETVDQARSNGLGVTGLRRVLRATEMGEVDTILMSRDFAARAVECTNCRHLDSHIVPYCSVCGRATRKLEDVCEALVPAAVRNNLALVLLPHEETLDQIGNIAALLRFRADRNKNQLLAAS